MSVYRKNNDCKNKLLKLVKPGIWNVRTTPWCQCIEWEDKSSAIRIEKTYVNQIIYFIADQISKQFVIIAQEVSLEQIIIKIKIKCLLDINITIITV